MKVHEIMTRKAEWVNPDATIRDVAKQMRDENIGSMPVGENDRLIGMITDRDIVCRAVAEGHDPATTSARKVMSKAITYCFDDQDVDDAAHMMEDKHIRRLAVLNRKKRLVGILSLDDLARCCSHDLSGEVLAAVSTRAH
ncbi:MAG TPA: CBS domain-containing protein [Alphaproteobacteria bacterium]|nr:CBS domain-containing protein [Alphaproteobacteria bacterium]